MSFFELLQSRRSVRQYTDEKVRPEIIEQIVTAALMSPASKSSNPWEFIVIENREMLVKLSQCRPHGSQLLAGSPLGIVVIGDTTKSDVWIEDTSIAAIIMQLEAHDLGLGSCWVQIHGRAKDEKISAAEYIRQLLNIPPHFDVLCIISIGHKDESSKANEQKKLQYKKIHREVY